MPGLTACVQCGTALTAEQVDVHPPRAGWTLRLRPLGYSLNRISERAPWVINLDRFGWIGELLDWFIESLFDLICAAISIVPGLGHLAARRFRPLRWLWPGWALCLGLGLYLYGSMASAILLGLAIAMHGWIICDAGRIYRIFDTALSRRGAVVCIFLALAWFGYGGIHRNYIEPRYTVVQIATTLNYEGVKAGDRLIVARDAYLREKPRRGDLILYTVDAQRIPGVIVHSGDSLGKLIGLPGEKIWIRNGLLLVRGPDGRRSSYQMPEEFNAPEMELQLGPDDCFCLAIGYRQQNHGRSVSHGEAVQLLGLTHPAFIHGRAVVICDPVWRRSALTRRDFPPPPFKDAIPAPPPDFIR